MTAAIMISGRSTRIFTAVITWSTTAGCNERSLILVELTNSGCGNIVSKIGLLQGDTNVNRVVTVHLKSWSTTAFDCNDQRSFGCNDTAIVRLERHCRV